MPPSPPAHAPSDLARPPQSLFERLNGPWHEVGVQLFMGVVLAHWAEHLAQAFQVYVLHWSMADAGGVLGLWFPWLVTSETLHYVYALVMLIGLWMLRTGFRGRSHTWWMAAFWLQFWHHIEHALLQAQVIAGENLLNAPEPMSLAQFVVPRLELHLIYNTLVFVPMIVAMARHLMPNDAERTAMRCSCAGPRQLTAAA